MFERTRIVLLAAVTAAGIHGVATADVEETIDYRQSVYTVIGWNFGPLRAMAQGKIDYDAGQAATHATRISQLSQMLDDAYAEPSTAEGSDAKALIWEDRDDFQEKLTAFQTEAAALAEATSGGADAAAMREQFVAMAQTCKGCHDRYKD